MSAQLISLPVAAEKHGSVCAPFSSLSDGQLEHEIKFLEDTVQPLRQFLMSVPGVRSLATNAAVARAARQLRMVCKTSACSPECETVTA